MSTIAEKTGGTFYVSTDLAAQWQGVDWMSRKTDQHIASDQHQ